MKPETKAWLDKVVPILAHLKEGGEVRYKDDGKLYGNTGVPYFRLLTRPDLYPIHVEPRIIYVNELPRDGGWIDHIHDEQSIASEAMNNAKKHFPELQTRRFVEDLNWKPDQADLDADHHLPDPGDNRPGLPDHTPPHLKPASDKPDLDADHRLPKPGSKDQPYFKQASNYMKTVWEEMDKAAAKAWLTEFAKEGDYSYEGLIAEAKQCIANDGHYIQLGTDTPSRWYDEIETFWKHIETVTGLKVADKTNAPFSCAC
jgi:hypothetical protein